MFTALARYEKLHDFVSEQVEIDLRYLDQAVSNHYDTLRFLDNKYSDPNDRKVFNEKVIILDLSTDEIAQRTINEVI